MAYQKCKEHLRSNFLLSNNFGCAWYASIISLSNLLKWTRFISELSYLTNSFDRVSTCFSHFFSSATTSLNLSMNLSTLSMCYIINFLAGFSTSTNLLILPLNIKSSSQSMYSITWSKWIPSCNPNLPPFLIDGRIIESSRMCNPASLSLLHMWQAPLHLVQIAGTMDLQVEVPQSSFGHFCCSIPASHHWHLISIIRFGLKPCSHLQLSNLSNLWVSVCSDHGSSIPWYKPQQRGE